MKKIEFIIVISKIYLIYNYNYYYGAPNKKKAFANFFAREQVD